MLYLGMLSKSNCKSRHLMERLLHNLERYQWKLSNIPFVFFPLVSRGTIRSCTKRHLWLKWLHFVINRTLTIQLLHAVVCTNGQVSGLFFKIAVPTVELALQQSNEGWLIQSKYFQEKPITFQSDSSIHLYWFWFTALIHEHWNPGVSCARHNHVHKAKVQSKEQLALGWLWIIGFLVCSF